MANNRKGLSVIESAIVLCIIISITSIFAHILVPQPMPNDHVHISHNEICSSERIATALERLVEIEGKKLNDSNLNDSANHDSYIN